jgi:LysR family transcriptional regulator, low CO2-responsive transcriptional regulator
MNNMDLVRGLTLRQLQIFEVAARNLSFARAAEQLHLTQPAISMQIKLLEDAIGTALFERVGKKVQLTEAGERLQHHASRILGELKDAASAFQSLSGLQSGSLHIGLVSTAKYFAPKLLALFTTQYPQLDVQLEVGNREFLLKLLQDNAIDLAIMGRPAKGLDALAEPLAQHPHVIIANVNHPLRKAKKFDLQELRHETFLLREPGSGTRVVAEEMFKNHLFTPKKIVTLGSNETIKQAVMAGMGVSLLSLHTLGLELRSDVITILDVMGTPVTRTWHVVHMRTKSLSPPALAYRKFMLDNAAEFLEQEFGAYVAEMKATKKKAKRKTAG